MVEFTFNHVCSIDMTPSARDNLDQLNECDSLHFLSSFFFHVDDRLHSLLAIAPIMSSTTVIELQPVVQGKTIIPPSTISAGQSGQRLSSERSLIQGDQSRLSEYDFPDLSTSRSAIIIAILTGIAAMTSMSTGILTVGLPVIANDIGLSGSLLLW